MKADAWRTADDPLEMLRALRGKASQRRLRLLACAVCRRLYETRLRDARSHAALEVAERYADGAAAKEDLVAARRAATAAREPSWRARRAVWWVTYGRPRAILPAILNSVVPAPWQLESANPRKRRIDPGGPIPARDRAAVCALVREIFNPFHGARLGLLSGHGGVVARLARAIYDERRFEDMPVLADALEEAGCSDEAALHHCRQPGGHVRGCWVLDLLLSRG